MTMKIHTGDTIIVITGKDKGKTGRVLRVLPLKERVVVGGVSMRTKHIKKTLQRPGQRIQFEGSIHMSNVMLIDSKSGKRSRVGFTFDEKGKKKRIAKYSGESVIKASIEEDRKETGKKAPVESPKHEPVVKGKPAKAPFWKRIGFGSDVTEQVAEGGQTPHSKEDHSLSDEGQASSRRSHGRGS